MASAIIGVAIAILIVVAANVEPGARALLSAVAQAILRRFNALGATAQQIVGSVLGRAARHVALGGVLGGVLAVLSLDLREVLVSRLGDGGPWALPLVLALLVLSGLCATGLPLRVQPSEAMRCE